MGCVTTLHMCILILGKGHQRRTSQETGFLFLWKVCSSGKIIIIIMLAYLKPRDLKVSQGLAEHRFGHLLRLSPPAELHVSWARVVAGDIDQSPAGGVLATKPINAQSPEEKPNKPGVELLHPAGRMAGRGRHGTHLTSPQLRPLLAPSPRLSLHLHTWTPSAGGRLSPRSVLWWPRGQPGSWPPSPPSSPSAAPSPKVRRGCRRRPSGPAMTARGRLAAVRGLWEPLGPLGGVNARRGWARGAPFLSSARGRRFPPFPASRRGGAAGRVKR